MANPLRKGSTLKRRLATLAALAAAAYAGAGLAPSSEPVAATPVASAKPCKAGFVHAVLASGHQCLRVGQACSRRLDPQYHRYRFHCHGTRLSRAAASGQRQGLTAAERRWVSRATRWAAPYFDELETATVAVNDELEHDSNFVANVRAGQEPAATVSADWLRTLRSCTPSLARVGRPPTRRLTPVYTRLQQACRRFAAAATSMEQGLNASDVLVVEEAANEVTDALLVLEEAVEMLAELASPTEAPSVRR